MNLSNKIRFYEIDLLRFLAAMAVVMFHYTFRGFAEGGYSSIEYPLMGEYSRYGYLGVNLFFMISGFVILLSAMNRTATKFAVSRIIRLYPAFWAGVTLSALFIFWFGAPRFSATFPQYLMNMSMISGYLGVEPIDGVYWTLLYEIKFYALIFLLLLFGKMKHIQLFLGIWLALVVLGSVVHLPKLLNFLVFPEWASLFISGSLFYLIHSRGMTIYRGGMLACAYWMALHYTVMEIHELTAEYHATFSGFIAIFWVTFFYLVFMLIALNKTSWLRSAWLVNVGLLTYPLYLIHENIGFIALNAFAGSLNKYVLLVVLVTAMLLVAWLIHVLVEKPVGKWLKGMFDRIGSAKWSTNLLTFSK